MAALISASVRRSRSRLPIYNVTPPPTSAPKQAAEKLELNSCQTPPNNFQTPMLHTTPHTFNYWDTTPYEVQAENPRVYEKTNLFFPIDPANFSRKLFCSHITEISEDISPVSKSNAAEALPDNVFSKIESKLLFPEEINQNCFYLLMGTMIPNQMRCAAPFSFSVAPNSNIFEPWFSTND